MNKETALAIARELKWDIQNLDRPGGPVWRFMIPLPGNYVHISECRDADLTVLEVAKMAMKYGQDSDLSGKLEGVLMEWADTVLQGVPVQAPFEPQQKPELNGPPPVMSLNTPIGSKIRFTNTNGTDRERVAANDILSQDAEYEVLEMNVGGFSSQVLIAEGWFNTVMFENAPEPDTLPMPDW